MGVKSKKNFTGIVCTCNMVPRTVIENAIGRGCHRMEQIFTATTAGVGQCGGSCRPEIEKILTSYLSTGQFTPIKK